jgi:hypothetical protein
VVPWPDRRVVVERQRPGEWQGTGPMAHRRGALRHMPRTTSQRRLARCHAEGDGQARHLATPCWAEPEAMEHDGEEPLQPGALRGQP